MKLKELLDVIDDTNKNVWVGVVDGEDLYYYIEGKNEMLKYFLAEEILNAKVQDISYKVDDDDLDSFQIEIVVDEEVEQ